jgi:hypothetical protein
MFATSILRCLKKNQILAFTYFQVIELTFKLTQISGPIQVVASRSKRHDYSNLTFEVHYLETLVFCCLHYFLCILFHAFTLYASDNYLFIIDNYISNLLIIFLHLCHKVFLWNNAQPHQYIVNWTLVIMYILRNLHSFQLKLLLPLIKNKISIFQEPPHSIIIFVTISIILYVPTWIIVNVSW